METGNPSIRATPTQNIIIPRMELTLMATSLMLNTSTNSAMDEGTFLGGFSWNRVLPSKMMPVIDDGTVLPGLTVIGCEGTSRAHVLAGYVGGIGKQCQPPGDLNDIQRFQTLIKSLAENGLPRTRS
jgi:hypothetical protein